METPSGGLGDYQIAPLPRSGKGRWRPRAAGWKYFAAGKLCVGADAHIRPHGWRKGYRQTCVGADGFAYPETTIPPSTLRVDTGCRKSPSLRASPQTGVAICSQIAQFLRFSANLQLKECGFPRRFAPRNDRIGLSTRWGGVLPRPGAFPPLSLSLSPTGYFLFRKKVTKERFKERGISISPFP